MQAIFHTGLKKFLCNGYVTKCSVFTIKWLNINHFLCDGHVTILRRS